MDAHDLEKTGKVDGDDKSIRDVSSTHEEMTARIVDHEAERALCRKFDWHLMPLLALMYLCNALDKGNLGNAKTAGFDKDLHFHANQYNILLSLFYIPYVLFGFPLALVAKHYGPARVLPAFMMVFGTMTLCSAATKNFSGMMAVRWFLGMAESAFFPTAIYYLTTFYRRGEMARRFAIFYAASNIANAFSGLLAFGVFHIHSGHLRPWRYLFLIEGALTVILAVICYFLLPRDAQSASFLTPAEKELALHRIQTDSSAIVNEKVSIISALSVYKMPQSWVWVSLGICLGVPLQSTYIFLPQIVGRLGLSTVKTNLYTVAPNVTGAIVLLILCFNSDWKRIRFPFIALGFLFPLIGFIIFASVAPGNHAALYFATFMMCAGSSVPSTLISVWYNNNIVSEPKRVALTSVGVPIANAMGLISSNIFRPQDAPSYKLAIIINSCFTGAGLVITLALGFWMLWDNKRRDRKQGVKLHVQDVSTEFLRDGPKHESFRWFL